MNVRRFRALVTAAMDGVVISLVRSAVPQHRVLIIRPDSIGDFVLWSNAGRELYAHYRQEGYSVVLLGNAVWAEWASGLGLADEVWALDTGRFVRNLRYRWSWLHRLRKAGFSKVIHPVHSRVFLVGDALARATNAAERVAPEGDCTNERRLKRLSDRWYSRLIPETSRQSMELLRHAEFMRGLGLSGFVARLPELPFSKAAPEFRSVSKPYAVLFVGGSWEGRVWRANNFGEIGRRLRECGVNVVLAGGPLDRIQATKTLDCMNGNAIDLIGKTSLSELTELLRNTVVVLSSETSAAHIGAAVGTPVVCILGGGHFGRFLPYVVEKQEPSRPTPIAVVQPMPCFGCSWRCIHPRERGEAVECVSDISVEQVWRHLEEIIPAWTRVNERIRQVS